LDYVNDLLQELMLVQSPLERDRYLNQLAQEFQLSFHSLEEQLKQLETKQRSTKRRERQSQSVPPPQTYEIDDMLEPPEMLEEMSTPSVQNKLPLTKVEKAERTLLYRLMNEQSIRNQLIQLPEFSFAHDQYQELYLLLDSYMSIHSDFQLADFIDYLKEETIKKLAIDISLQTISEESSEREITDVIRVIENSSLEDQIAEKQLQKKEAERLGNKPLVDELSIEVIGLVRQLQKSRTVS